MSDMQAPRPRKPSEKAEATVADRANETSAASSGAPVDPVAKVRQLVEARTIELDSGEYVAARNFLVQAVELSELPTRKARTAYVKYFYLLGHMFQDKWQSTPQLVREMGALGSAQYRDGVGFWFRHKHDWKTWKNEWPGKSRRGGWEPNPLRRPYLAAIAVASETVQEIRFLNHIVTQAFDTAAIAPVDVDDQLVSITEQLLGAATVREKIGAQPQGTTAEIIHAQQLWQRQTRELDEAVWTPALTRIAALIAYRDKLHAVRLQNAAIERIGSSVGIDNALDALIAGSGSNELGSSRITASTAELQQAQAARSKALAEVRGDYLNALRP